MVTAKEYFGDWAQVIDLEETIRVLLHLKSIDNLCPERKNIFKAFKLCPYKECRVIFIAQDPYPQKGVATGIAFANDSNTPEDQLSPSLQVLKETIIDYTLPHDRIEFDNSLESWCKQGVLLLNSALTCEVNKVGCHYNIWKPFISKFIENMSLSNPALIWVLLGNQAISFKKYIKGFQNIITEYHPAYYARQGIKMPNIFNKINKILIDINNQPIKFYNYGI